MVDIARMKDTVEETGAVKSKKVPLCLKMPHELLGELKDMAGTIRLSQAKIVERSLKYWMARERRKPSFRSLERIDKKRKEILGT